MSIWVASCSDQYTKGRCTVDWKLELVAVPVGFTTFPGEIWAAPRSWVETVYPTLSYYNEVDRGGHFAAWEEPALFASEVRAAFSSLRR